MDSLNALLVACNYTHTVSVERLVRAAHLVANIYDDKAMADWCSAELQGYSGSTVPSYRKLPAKLMVSDMGGFQIPLVFPDAETNATVSQWPDLRSISLVEQSFITGRGRTFKSEVPADIASQLRSVFDLNNKSAPFHLISVDSLGHIVSTVRQKVFEWAVDASSRLPVRADNSAAVERMLGLPPSSPATTQPATSSPGVTGMPNLYASGSAQVVIVQQSSGVTVGRDVSTTNEVAALQTLLSSLEKVVGESIAAGASGKDVEPVVELIDEVKGLVAMPRRRPGLVESTVSAVKELAKTTATAVAAELAKPHVISALSMVAAAL
jgi:hypothetical protein